MKTTNAKSKAFQTPAPLDQIIKTQKRTSTRKAKIHHDDPVQVSHQDSVVGNEDDYPEIEYMPPAPTPLSDPPMEIPYDDTFPQFKDGNLTRGWWDEYAYRKGEDGLTDWERNEKKEKEEYERDVDSLIRKTFDEMEIPGFNVREYSDEECEDERRARLKAEENAKAKTEEGPSSTSTTQPSKSQPSTIKPFHPVPSTVRSRSAATALSNPSKLAPPISTKPRQPPAPAAPKTILPSFFSTKPTPTPTNPSPMRHTASTATSRQTLGYAKGRSVSGALRPRINTTNTIANTRKPTSASKPARETKASGENGEIDASRLSVQEYIERKGVPKVGSDLWYRATQLGYFETATDALAGKLKVEKPLELGELFGDIDVPGEEADEEFELRFE
jgi:hypothetical protein